MQCPHCQSKAVVKYGKTSNGKERFRCQQRALCGRTFLQSYASPGCLPTVKQQRVEMTLNGSGIQDIACVRQVGSNTYQADDVKRADECPTGAGWPSE